MLPDVEKYIKKHEKYAKNIEVHIKNTNYCGAGYQLRYYIFVAQISYAKKTENIKWRRTKESKK